MHGRHGGVYYASVMRECPGPHQLALNKKCCIQTRRPVQDHDILIMRGTEKTSLALDQEQHNPHAPNDMGRIEFDIEYMPLMCIPKLTDQTTRVYIPHLDGLIVTGADQTARPWVKR